MTGEMCPNEGKSAETSITATAHPANLGKFGGRKPNLPTHDHTKCIS